MSYFWDTAFDSLKRNEWFYNVSNFSLMGYSPEEPSAIITQESQDNFFDLSDDGNDGFPVSSGSDIESETEEEYTVSDTTDEDELEQNAFGTGPIRKRRRGCRTRGGIRGGQEYSW